MVQLQKSLINFYSNGHKQGVSDKHIRQEISGVSVVLSRSLVPDLPQVSETGK